MKKFVFVMALLCAAATCAGAAYAEEARIQKIVPVKTGDPVQIFQTVRDLLGSTVGVKLYQNNIVLNGVADTVAAAETLVHNLDISAPTEHDVDITGYIVLASAQSDGAANMPADLEPVLKQFRNLLTYKSFRVLDTIILRAKENSPAHAEGFLPLPNVPQPGASDIFSISRTTISGDTVHLKDLALRVSVPTPVGGPVNNGKATPLVTGVAFTPRAVNIGTDVDIKTGQKIAIGKASVNASGDALILVVSAKVVD